MLFGRFEFCKAVLNTMDMIHSNKMFIWGVVLTDTVKTYQFDISSNRVEGRGSPVKDQEELS